MLAIQTQNASVSFVISHLQVLYPDSLLLILYFIILENE